MVIVEVGVRREDGVGVVVEVGFFHLKNRNNWPKLYPGAECGLKYNER